MSTPKKGLGRGLGSLLEEMAPETSATGSPEKIAIQKIEPNPSQPRKYFSEEELADLADSIALHGIIQPLAVMPTENGMYRIIAGERRWRAARMAGLSELPVVILSVDEKTASELALVENLQRENLNPIEEALGIQALIQEYGETQEQISERLGKSRSAIANAIRLLSLPESLQDLVITGSLSAGHARTLLALPESIQITAAQTVIANGLSVRQTEALVKKLNSADNTKTNSSKTVTLLPNYIADCEQQLAKQLGRNVRIKKGRKKGHIELDFYDENDLQYLYSILSQIKSGE